MNKIYGIRHAGIFFPLLQVMEEGFIYKDKKYTWKDIVVLKRDDSIFSVLGGYPSATLLLSDATIIRIPVRIDEKGKHEWLKFQLFGYKNKAYDELVSLIEFKKSKIISSLERNIVGRNYIFLYKLLILVGVGFLLPLLIAPLVSTMNIDKELITISISYSLVIFFVGAIMFIRKIKLEKQIKEQLTHSKNI